MRRLNKIQWVELTPNIGGKGGHGGYAGPAVKPIALNMVTVLGTDGVVHRSGLPISAMGGITTWRDAAEFPLLGASSLQVCTAVLHYGFRIIGRSLRWPIELDGLEGFREDWRFCGQEPAPGLRLPGFRSVVPRGGAHRHCEIHQVQSVLRGVHRRDAPVHDLIDAAGSVVEPYSYDVRSNGKLEASSTRPQPRVREEDCVGCRLCYNVCPVDQCIEMMEVHSGRESVTWEQLVASEREVTEDWEAMKKYREKVGIHVH